MAADVEALTARLMRESLTKSDTVTEPFDHRLSTMEAAMRPTQVRTHAFRNAHENIDNTLKAAASVLTEFDVPPQVENRIMEGPRSNLHSFLLAVDQLQTNVEFFTFSRSFKSSDNARSHARGLLSEAMSKLEEEFKHLLTIHSKSVDPAQLILSLPSTGEHQPENPPASGASFASADGKKADSRKAPPRAGEPPSLPMPIPSNVLPQLHEMAQRLIAAGHHQQCIEAYRDVRSATLEQSLRELGVEKLSKEDVQKMPWEALEGKIGNWIQYIRIAVTWLFATERKVCDMIFHHLDPHREKCFAEVTESSSNMLLSFGEAIAKSKKTPEKLFVLLDMYETMRDVTPEVETMFAGRACAGMRKAAVGLTKRLALSARVTFGDFEVAVEKDATKTLVQDGAVHPLTSYVISYVNFLSDYQTTLKQLFGEQEKDGKTASHLAGATMRIMQVLHANLEGKAKMYKDPALSQLFLRNNVHYMVKSVGRSEAKDLLGDDWIQRHRRIVQQHANASDHAGKVLQHLSGQGLSSSLSGELSSGTGGGDSGSTRAQPLSYVLAALLMAMFFSIVAGSISPTGISFEVNALITMKLDLEDPGNALESWDKHAIDPCRFIHITCSNQLSVVRIDLSSAKLTGTLSPAVGSLPNLEHLVMPNNFLYGILPLELGTLSNLVTLDLANNKFNGTIPSTIEQLQNLVYLRLNRNSFSGSFPAFLSNMTRLQYVDLSFNNLSPPVPNISAPNFNITGNPLLCGSGPARGCPPPVQYMPITTTSRGYAASHKSNGWFLACGLVSAAVVLVAITLGFHSWKRRCNKQVFFDVHAQGPEAPLGQLKKFTLKELQAATDNFDSKNVLGKGGFGHVYKGSLPDGSLIAVKRLKDATIAGGELQFQMEVEMISMAVHRNLLRLWGFCMTPTERLLVYPFMVNGSVASRLHDTILGKPALDWPMRKRIAIGAARGLLYLHEHCDPKIIHRDVKAANILLDEGFEAVVGDFGLAKLLDHEDTHITTAVRGTVGHIAPEYLSTGQSSEKTDVFGYGILLLELITGERAFDFGRIKQRKDVMLLDWVKTLHHEKKLECLADPRLKTDFNAFELEEMVQVALLCTQSSPLDRPSMAMVVRMLEGDGLAERWEEWQKVELRRSEEARLLPRRYDRLLEDSTFDLEAVELSGPR